MIKRATRAMNIASGVIILVSGIYIDYSFADFLGLETRAMIGLLATVYAIARLVSEVKNMQRSGGQTAT